MKVYINRQVVKGPWGGGNAWVKAMYDFLPAHDIHPVTYLADIPDVILLAGIGPEGICASATEALEFRNHMLLNYKRRIPIIYRVNENDARKGTTDVDAQVLNIAERCDSVVYVSRWLSQYFNQTNNIKSFIIRNGVDFDIYKRRPEMKLNNGKINLAAHHWSDNVMKGFDIYNELDVWLGTHPDYTFTYIGRDRGTFKNTKVVAPLFGKALGLELSKYDLYISASRHDPGPNHIIESISTGMPTYVHADGGGCVEFSGIDHSYSNFKELLNIIMSKSYVPNDTSYLTPWEDCVNQFANLLKGTTHDKKC